MTFNVRVDLFFFFLNLMKYGKATNLGSADVWLEEFKVNTVHVNTMVAKVDNAHWTTCPGMQNGGQCEARAAYSCVVSGVVRLVQGQRSQVGVSKHLERLTRRR